MKLFLLKAKPGDPLWKPWYDKHFGFIVRANDEGLARTMAATEADKGWLSPESSNAWLSAEHATCIELTADGPAEIILSDFWSA